MMTSRECGFGCGFVRRGAVVAVLFLALAFTAGAASGSDNAAFVSYTGVPTSMKPNEQKTVTVKMRNTGTTTWKTTIDSAYSDGVLTTTRTSYHLDPVGHGWGVSGVTATLAFTITVSQALNVGQESTAPAPGAGGGGERGSPPPSGVLTCSSTGCCRMAAG